MQYLQRLPESPFELFPCVEPAQVHMLVDCGLPECEMNEGQWGGYLGREGQQGDQGVCQQQDHYVLYHSPNIYEIL